MPAEFNFDQWILPIELEDYLGRRIEVRINKMPATGDWQAANAAAFNLETTSPASSIRLSAPSHMYYGKGLGPRRKKLYTEKGLMYIENGELYLIDHESYTGVSNGVTKSEDLRQYNTTLNGHIFNDPNRLYRIEIAAINSNGTYDVWIIGYTKLGLIEKQTYRVEDGGESSEYHVSVWTIPISPIHLLEERTIEDLVAATSASYTQSHKHAFLGLTIKGDAQVEIKNYDNIISWATQPSLTEMAYVEKKEPTGIAYPHGARFITLAAIVDRLQTAAGMSSTVSMEHTFRLYRANWTEGADGPPPVPYGFNDQSFTSLVDGTWAGEVYYWFNVLFGIVPYYQSAGTGFVLATGGSDTLTMNTSSEFVVANVPWENDTALFATGVGATPPISNYQTYYVVQKTATTFKISLTKGGSPITISSTDGGFFLTPRYFNTPFTIRHEQPLTELVKMIHSEWGLYLDFEYDSTNHVLVPKWKNALASGSLIPAALQFVKHEEHAARKKYDHVVVSIAGSSSKYYCPTKLGDGISKEVMHDTRPWSWRAQSRIKHYKLDQGTPDRDQKGLWNINVSTIGGSSVEFNPNWALPGHYLYYYNPTNSNIAYDPERTDDPSTYEGMYAATRVKYKGGSTDMEAIQDDTVWDSLASETARFWAQTLLNDGKEVVRTFIGAVGDTGSFNDIKLNQHEFIPLDYEANGNVFIKVRAIEIEQDAMEGWTRITSVPSPVSTELDDSLEVLIDNGAGQTFTTRAGTSGGGSSSGNSTGDYLPRLPKTNAAGTATSTAVDITPLSVQGFNGQTAHLFDFKVDNSGTISTTSYVDKDGSVFCYGIALRIQTKTANYTLTNTDGAIKADTTSGNITLTLPATPKGGQMHMAVKPVAANTLTVSANTGHTINRTVSLTTEDSGVILVFDGTSQWLVIAETDLAGISGLTKTPNADGDNLIVIQNAGTKGLIVRAFNGQTDNLQEWQEHTGNIWVKINNNGELYTYQDVHMEESGTIVHVDTLDCKTQIIARQESSGGVTPLLIIADNAPLTDLFVIETSSGQHPVKVNKDFYLLVGGGNPISDPLFSLHVSGTIGLYHATVGLTPNPAVNAGVNIGAGSSVEFTAAGAATISGFAARIGHQLILLHNSSANAITINNNDVAEPLGNRVMCPGGVAFVLDAGTSCWLYYSALALNWSLIKG